MSKREPTEPLDRNFEDTIENPSVLIKATEEEIKARKIYTIKRPIEQETQQTKPAAGFIFQKADIKGTEGHESNGSKANGDANQQTLHFEIKPPTTTQMFSGSISMDTAKVNTGLFFNNAKTVIKADEKIDSTAVNSQENGQKEEPVAQNANSEVEAKQQEQIDEQKADDTQKVESKSEPEKKIDEAPAQKNLFGGSGMFGQNTGSSLFAPNPNPLQENNQPSLFGNTHSNLFGNVQSSIFGGPCSGLFPSNEQKTSIFGNVGTKFFENVKNKDEEGDEDDGDEEEPKEEEVPEDLTASANQDPNSITVVIKNCKNFKIDNNEALGLGYVSIEQPKDKENFFMLVFRNKAKRILHSSLVIPKISVSCFMKGKKTAMTVSTRGMGLDEATGKLTKQNAKIGFDNEDDAADFMQEVEKIFNK